MPVSYMDSKPLGEIAEQFREIAKILTSISADAGKASNKGGHAKQFAEIQASLAEIVTALRALASGR